MSRPTVFILAWTAALALGGSARADYINFTFLGTTSAGAGLSGAGVINLSDGPTGTHLATSGQLSVFGDTSVAQAFLTANPNGFDEASAPGVPSGTKYSDYYDNVVYDAGVSTVLNGNPLGGSRVASGLNPRIDPNGLYFSSGSNAVFLYILPIIGAVNNYKTIVGFSYKYTDYNIVTGLALQGSISMSFGSVIAGTAPIVPNAVPEPGSWLMLGLGCVALVLMAQKPALGWSVAAT